jgi:RNA-directed DNA polymerase
MSARNKLVDRARTVFRQYISQSPDRVVHFINPVLRGRVQYFRAGNSGKCSGYIKDRLTGKIRRHMMRAGKRSGFGWKRQSTEELYGRHNIHCDFRVLSRKAAPARQAVALPEVIRKAQCVKYACCV